MLFRRMLLALGVVVALAACPEGPEGGLPGPGEPCGQDAPCRVGFCHVAPGGAFCSATCDEDASCPDGFVCLPEPAYQARICLPGARCDSDAACPAGHRCDVGTGRCYVAVARDLCGACTSDAQCPAGGLCVRSMSTGERFCSTPCKLQRDCPQGYGCRSLVQDGVSYDGIEAERQCLPLSSTCNARLPLCSPCAGDWECGAAWDLCLEDRRTGARFCGRHCSPTCVWSEDAGEHRDTQTGERCSGVCPPRFACLDVGGAHQCVPDEVGCEGFCEAETPLEERLACGPGGACDRASRRCVTALDGRTCAPCVQGSCPSDGAQQSTCLVNHETGESFCAATCDDDADCRAVSGLGFSCVDVEGRRHCVPDGGSCQVGVTPVGGACEAGADCAGGACLRFGERGLCSGACLGDEDCGDARWTCCAVSDESPGFDCEAEREGPGLCVPRGGGFGDPCEAGRPPCEAGYCMDVGSGRVCTAACSDDADCDEVSLQSGAFQCLAAYLEGSDSVLDRVQVCYPRGGQEVGADCTFGPGACADAICLERKGGPVCTKECREDEACPPGWSCGVAETEDGIPWRVCLPP